METIAVIGLGSMGKRRIRLLKNQLGKKVIGIDTNIERLTEVTEITSKTKLITTTLLILLIKPKEKKASINNP